MTLTPQELDKLILEVSEEAPEVAVVALSKILMQTEQFKVCAMAVLIAVAQAENRAQALSAICANMGDFLLIGYRARKVEEAKEKEAEREFCGRKVQ